MLFNSFTFAVFLPVVFLLYWFVFNRGLRLQNLFLVLASYVFYAWWDWRFLFLMAFISFCSWGSGLLMQLIETEKIKTPRCITAKTISAGNIILSLGVLSVFKYYDFFAENLIAAFTSLGIHLHPSTLRIILPVGISFYTFHALSYSIDVYKKRVPATKDIIAFFAFISFFPLLVAGPIERATNLLPQMYRKRVFDYGMAVDGMRQILWGLFKKIVIADSCANITNEVFNNYTNYSGGMLVLAALFFAIQIYGDFAGYSDIALGTARLFGFNVIRNFAFPCFSRDIAEFWRRWHISLTTWFRDYLYIPLGGSRVSKGKAVRNTFIIFLVSGFWHGANWTYITWGAYHALLFLPLILRNKNRKNTDIVAEGKRYPSWKELFQMITTFGLVAFGLIVFRSDNIAIAGNIISRIFSSSLFIMHGIKDIPVQQVVTTCFYILLFMLIEWCGRQNNYAIETLYKERKTWLRYLFYLILALITLCHSMKGEVQEFIYFQF